LEALETLQEEMIDRFGLPPEPTKALLESHRLRILGKELGITKIDASAEAIQLQFIPNPPIDAGRIIALIQRNRNYKLSGPDRLRINLSAPQIPERVAQVKSVLKELA
jgi:transcription-repair coupling factor (superfamily II helicase)